MHYNLLYYTVTNLWTDTLEEETSSCEIISVLGTCSYPDPTTEVM